MSNQKNEYPSLAPCLLLAIPQLMDPNFQRSVVLLVENQEEGSVGLVLNLPTKLKVKQVLENIAMDWFGDPEALVWNGGPVFKEQGWVLHSQAEIDVLPAPVEVVDGIFLSGTAEQLRCLAQNPPEHCRFMLGSSGWGGNQLETEIAQGWWLTLEADAEMVFQTSPEEIWDKAFRSMGIDPGKFTFNSTIH